MSDPIPALAAAKVRELKPAAGADDAVRAEPLVFEYTTTRVVPDALRRLRSAQGVVRGDRSELAEAFKMLRNQVLQRMRPQGQSVLAVTSPRAIEGKSLAALNLALAIAAEYDSTVLLIDADLSGKGLQRRFGLGDPRGLSDCLSHDAPLSELLVNPGIDRLVFLPAGQAVLDSAELLSARSMQHLVQEMKRRYRDRYIVVDLPPLLDTADALAFLPAADTTLLVVEENTTSLEDVDHAAALLAPYALIGTVISEARDKDELRPDAGATPWWRRWRRR